MTARDRDALLQARGWYQYWSMLEKGEDNRMWTRAKI